MAYPGKVSRSKVRHLFVSTSGGATRPIQRELHPEDGIAAADLAVHDAFTKRRHGPNAHPGLLTTVAVTAGTQVRGASRLRGGFTNPVKNNKFI